MIDSQKKGTPQVGHPQVGVTASEVTGFISDSGQGGFCENSWSG